MNEKLFAKANSSSKVAKLWVLFMQKPVNYSLSFLHLRVLKPANTKNAATKTLYLYPT
jgi:hypothetical protein